MLWGQNKSGIERGGGAFGGHIPHITGQSTGRLGRHCSGEWTMQEWLREAGVQHASQTLDKCSTGSLHLHRDSGSE